MEGTERRPPGKESRGKRPRGRKYCQQSQPRCQKRCAGCKGTLLFIYNTPALPESGWGEEKFGIQPSFEELHLSIVNWEGSVQSRSIQHVLFSAYEFNSTSPCPQIKHFFFPLLQQVFPQRGGRKEYLMCLHLSTRGLKKTTQTPVSC